METWQLLATSQQAIKGLTVWKILLPFNHTHNPNAKGSNKFRVALHLPRTQPPEPTYQSNKKWLSAEKTRHRLLKTDVPQMTHKTYLIGTYSFLLCPSNELI